MNVGLQILIAVIVVCAVFIPIMKLYQKNQKKKVQNVTDQNSVEKK